MILVTGGSGFLGGHLVRELSRRGERVRALYNTRQPGGDIAKLPGVEWLQADLLDIYDVEAAMKDVTDVYHCAAIVSFDPRRREEMLHFNPESTANIVNQALEQGIRKLVYVSSVAALGRSGHMNKETDEEQEWGESGYNSAYGISKYLAENEVWRGVGEGLCAAIVCPSLILGPGDWSSGSPQIMTVVNKEFPFYTGGVNGMTDLKTIWGWEWLGGRCRCGECHGAIDGQRDRRRTVYSERRQPCLPRGIYHDGKGAGQKATPYKSHPGNDRHHLARQRYLVADNRGKSGHHTGNCYHRA